MKKNQKKFGGIKKNAYLCYMKKHLTKCNKDLKFFEKKTKKNLVVLKKMLIFVISRVL